MTSKPNVLSIDQAETLLLGLLKVSAARKKYASPGVIGNLISPPSIQAGPRGEQVTHPGWGAAQAGLLGAGAGGALSFGRALFDKERRKRLLQETLHGATMGGGIGGGLGLLGYGVNYGLNYGGPLPPQQPTRAQEALSQFRRGGVPALVNYGNNEINHSLGLPPQDSALVLPGAAVGGAAGGALGLGAGRHIDASRSEAAQNAPVTRARADHAAAMAAHQARIASPSNLRQDIHNLASVSPDVQKLLNAPIPGATGSRMNALNSTTTPTVTHTELGLPLGQFEALRQRAVTHSAGPAPAFVPGSPLPTAPWRIGGRFGGPVIGGALGAIAGSQLIPRLFGPTNSGATGYGN